MFQLNEKCPRLLSTINYQVDLHKRYFLDATGFRNIEVQIRILSHFYLFTYFISFKARSKYFTNYWSLRKLIEFSCAYTPGTGVVYLFY